MADSSSSTSVFDSSLSLHAMTHLVTIKLKPTNYLMWYGQIYPLLVTQKFLPFVDGSSPPPPSTITKDDVVSPNPAFSAWFDKDQIIRVFLVSTLTEEAMAVIVGCTSSAAIWSTLASAFNQPSKARELRLKDELQLIKKGARSVTEYGAIFKNLCDQLLAMGCSLDETDKSHWFLRGLGSDFHGFSTSQINLTPLPSFTELLSKAESHDLFTKSLDVTSSTTQSPAFLVHRNQSKQGSRSDRGSSGEYPNRGDRYNYSRGNFKSGGRGRGRYTPRCQICKHNGHFAIACPERYVTPSPQANLAQAFQSTCSLNRSANSDWYVDTGASAHMTNSRGDLDSVSAYSGSDKVIVGNESGNRNSAGQR